MQSAFSHIYNNTLGRVFAAVDEKMEDDPTWWHYIVFAAGFGTCFAGLAFIAVMMIVGKITAITYVVILPGFLFGLLVNAVFIYFLDAYTRTQNAQTLPPNSV